MSGHGHGSFPAPSTRLGWWLAAIAAVIVYAAGVYGYWRHGIEHGELTVSDAFYAGVQIFAFEPPHVEGRINGWIEFARFGAVFLGFGALVAVVRRMFAGEIVRMRLRFVEGHVVIIADGDEMLAAATAVRARKPAALIAVVSGHHDARELEATVRRTVSIDRVPGGIEAARVHAASEVLIIGTNDAANLAAAISVCRKARESRASLEPLVCLAQIRSVTLRESLRTLALPAVRSHSYVRTFDHVDRSVRDVVSQQLPIDGAAGAPRLPIHVVVVGAGEAAISVAAAAIRLGFDGVKNRLRLTVITDEPGAWAKQWEGRFPAIDELCEYSVHSRGPFRQQLPWLHQVADASDRQVTFFFCPPDDGAAVEWLAEFLGALQGRRARIAVHVRGDDGLYALLSEQARAAGCELVPFGALDADAWRRLLEDDTREQLARHVHARFRQLAGGQGRTAAADDALAEWAELVHEDYKDSNRQQVDHIWVKLRAVNCEVVPASDPRPPAEWSKEEVDRLARLEHARWCAERRMAGWTFADGPKNDVAKTSPNLVDWDRLDEITRDYDRDAVRNIPHLLSAVGKKISRRT